MSENESALVRLWRLRPWSSSPLLRVSDRLEVLVRAFAVLLVVVSVPVCGAIGTVTYTGAAARIAAADVGKDNVSAVLTADTVRMPAADRYGAHQDRYEAAVKWTHDGGEGTATVEVTGPQSAGAQVMVWIGADGKPTAAPAKPGTAAAEGIGTGLAILVESWFAAAAAVWITSTVVESRRNSRWDREWRLLNRPIGKDTL